MHWVNVIDFPFTQWLEFTFQPNYLKLKWNYEQHLTLKTYFHLVKKRKRKKKSPESWQWNILAFLHCCVPQLRALSCPSPETSCWPSHLHLLSPLTFILLWPWLEPCLSPRLAACPCHALLVRRGGLRNLWSRSDLFHHCQELQLITDEMDLIWTLSAGQTPAQTQRRDRKGGAGMMKLQRPIIGQRDHLWVWSVVWIHGL